MKNVDINRNIATAKTSMRKLVRKETDWSKLTSLLAEQDAECNKLGILIAMREYLKHQNFLWLIDEYSKSLFKGNTKIVLLERIKEILNEVMDNSLLEIMLEKCDNEDVRNLIYFRSLDLADN